MPNHKRARAWRAVTLARAIMLVVLVALGASLPLACSRKDDGSSKPAGIAPQASTPGALPAAPAAPPPLAPPLPPPAVTGGAPEAASAPEVPVDPKAAISGTVVLPAARRHDVAATDTIFLVARRIADNPQARGTLVAVKRLSAASIPIPFTLSARDMMIPTGSFDGEVSLAVRVDKDGDPMTRRKGDVFGSLPKVSVGARGVKLSLDQLQAEDESLAGSGPMSPHATMPPGHP